MSQLTAVLGLAIGLINLVGLIYVTGWRLGRLDLKTETMWKYLFEAAFVEARQRGVITANSAYKINAKTKQQFMLNDLGKDIYAFYRDHHLSMMPDSGATWELFKQFQRELTEQICMPLGLNMGAALVGALQLCKEWETVDA